MVDMKDVKRKFYKHKYNAKRRGIDFKLTFDQWWQIWKPHWSKRGSKVGQFVMCRTMDKGAYEIGNVRIDTPKGNAHTRSLVAFDKLMEERKQANIIESYEYEDDEEESWLPRHLRVSHTMTDMYEKV